MQFGTGEFILRSEQGVKHSPAGRCPAPHARIRSLIMALRYAFFNDLQSPVNKIKAPVSSCQKGRERTLRVTTFDLPLPHGSRPQRVPFIPYRYYGWHACAVTCAHAAALCLFVKTLDGKTPRPSSALHPYPFTPWRAL